MKKYILCILITTILTIFVVNNLYSQGLQPFLKSSYLNESGKVGTEFEIGYGVDELIYEFTGTEKGAVFGDFFKFRANIKEVENLKNIQCNFNLLNINYLTEIPNSSINYFNLAIVNSENTRQINSYFDWFKLSFGIGKIMDIGFNKRSFADVYLSVGFSYAYFDDSCKAFSNQTFHGFQPVLGLRYEKREAGVRCSFKNEFKAILGGKCLEIINPKIEFGFDILSLTGYSSDFIFKEKPVLEFSFAYSYSKIYYKSNSDESSQLKIGLNYSFNKGY